MKKKNELSKTLRMSADVKENLEIIRKIEAQFDKIYVSSSDEIERLLVDLADIYSESKAYVKLIDNFVRKRDITKDKVGSMLITIEIMLFQHIYWHMKDLSKSLDKTIAKLHKQKKVSRNIKTIYKFK